MTGTETWAVRAFLGEMPLLTLSLEAERLEQSDDRCESDDFSFARGSLWWKREHSFVDEEGSLRIRFDKPEAFPWVRSEDEDHGVLQNHDTVYAFRSVDLAITANGRLTGTITAVHFDPGAVQAFLRMEPIEAGALEGGRVEQIEIDTPLSVGCGDAGEFFTVPTGSGESASIRCVIDPEPPTGCDDTASSCSVRGFGPRR